MFESICMSYLQCCNTLFAVIIIPTHSRMTGHCVIHCRECMYQMPCEQLVRFKKMFDPSDSTPLHGYTLLNITIILGVSIIILNFIFYEHKLIMCGRKQTADSDDVTQKIVSRKDGLNGHLRKTHTEIATVARAIQINLIICFLRKVWSCDNIRFVSYRKRTTHNIYNNNMIITIITRVCFVFIALGG